MAIKKSEYQNFDNTQVDAIEAKIDHSLRSSDRTMLTFDTRGWSGAVKREIERRYREAGWTVEFVNDQRDGDFMVLK